jgi:predicted SAM-dependent methyltransferase
LEFNFQANTLDAIVLCSVFTHVTPETVSNYLGQFADLLRENGRIWATVYLIEEDADRYAKDDRDFDHDLGGYYTPYPDNPEHSIAYDEELFHELVADAGLTVETFVYGHWRGTEALPDTQPRWYQDQIVLSPANS